MEVYFDSSVLLSMILDENGKSRAENIWRQAEGKMSSLLLEAEVRVAARRSVSKVPGKTESDLVRKESEAEILIREVELLPFTPAIMEIIRNEKSLAKCRTLDAIHLATALFLQREAGEPFTVCSYDTRMREAARGLGFAVLP